MNYALVENGNVTSIGLPQTGILKNGNTVSGYDLLDESQLLDEGWLPLVSNIPEYNSETQIVSLDGYTIEADQVLQKYKIEDKIVPPETDAEKITRLLVENSALLAETTRLAARDAQMQDDQMFILEALVTAGII